MDSATIQKLKDAISNSKSIGIAVGQAPSVDEMAAALSLHLLLKNANKRTSIASANNPIVEVSSLVGVNQVQTTLGGGEAGDLVVSFPYKDGEIEKVSYTLDDQKGFLNIIVKAGENGLSFEEKDILYTRGSQAIDLLVTVGASQLADIGTIIDPEKLRDIKIINIDVKAQNQGFGDIVLVSPHVSSVSEHVANILLSLGFQFDQDTAQNLLSGVMHATQNFQSPRTSAQAFELAALLMKKGARRQETPPAANQSADPFGLAPRPQPAAPTMTSSPVVPTQPVVQPIADRKPVQPPVTASQPQTAPTPAVEQRSPDESTPIDWLTPKVYKGSSNF